MEIEYDASIDYAYCVKLKVVRDARDRVSSTCVAESTASQANFGGLLLSIMMAKSKSRIIDLSLKHKAGLQTYRLRSRRQQKESSTRPTNQKKIITERMTVFLISPFLETE
ncbi:LOW QUALITY PROTEIN: hexokinase family protein [Aspergillus luchuensis]|uniref:Hexokinase family protein n=1 Tax=Aspergillus kawachii TaxID=1069201 RepID=A0A146FG77_ASPKA|nr:LOW QUALITY PROTEIN: hexokinase family protein [Aspergillus luchuensis]